MVALTSADLKSESLFSCLSIDQLEQLLSGHRETTLEVCQIVLTEQDWDDSIYFLRSGLAKVRTYSADGEEVIMCLLGPGDVFGEMAVVERASRGGGKGGVDNASELVARQRRSFLWSGAAGVNTCTAALGAGATPDGSPSGRRCRFSEDRQTDA